jgi:hypothetical protein
VGGGRTGGVIALRDEEAAGMLHFMSGDEDVLGLGAGLGGKAEDALELVGCAVPAIPFGVPVIFPGDEAKNAEDRAELVGRGIDGVDTPVV